LWGGVTPWQVGMTQYLDEDIDTGVAYQYRIKSRKGNGKTASSTAQLVPAL